MSGRLYHGWIIVGGAFVVLFLAYGTQYAFGVFFAALLAEFPWSRASLSGAFSLYAFVYSAFGLVAGRMTDRWGPRAVIAGGGLLLGAGLAGMSLVDTLWQPYVLYGGVAALGMSTAYVPCNATVVRWFVRRRGLAVGLASAGGSLGTFVLPPVAHWLVSALGWRRAYLVFGAAIFLALGGVALLMRRDPESLGLHPDGAPAPAPTGSLGGWTMRDAVRVRAFWVLFAIFGLTWIPVFIPLVHLVPLARDLGIDALRAATLVSALGIAAVAGRLAMGWLSDRIGRRAILGVGACRAGVVLRGPRPRRRAARPRRRRAPLRLFLRHRVDDLPGHGRGLLRPRPCGSPRRTALRPRRAHRRAGTGGRGLDLRSLRRL